MSLDRLLYFIGIAAWVLLALYVVGFLWRDVPKHGLVNALLRLVFRRVLYLLILVVVGLSLLNSSVIFLQPQQVGVVVSLLAPDGYRDRPLRSGLRWVVPLMERVRIYPISWQTYTMSGKPDEGQRPGNDSIAARTSDGQEVMLDCSVIFQIDAEQVIRINIDWQERYVEDFIRPLTRGIVRTQVSQYTVDEVNSFKRLDLERDINERLRAEIREKGFVLDRFILRNISFSPEYAAAVEKKQVALQEAIEKQHQADQIRRLAQGQADQVKILAAADAEAIRIRAAAQAEALQVIARALEHNDSLLTYEYIQKLAPDIRVMLVPNNAPLILPLPSMGADEQRAASPGDGRTPGLGLSITPTISLTPTRPTR